MNSSFHGFVSCSVLGDNICPNIIENILDSELESMA